MHTQLTQRILNNVNHNLDDEQQGQIQRFVRERLQDGFTQRQIILTVNQYSVKSNWNLLALLSKKWFKIKVATK